MKPNLKKLKGYFLIFLILLISACGVKEVSVTPDKEPLDPVRNPELFKEVNVLDFVPQVTNDNIMSEEVIESKVVEETGEIKERKKMTIHFETEEEATNFAAGMIIRDTRGDGRFYLVYKVENSVNRGGRRDVKDKVFQVVSIGMDFAIGTATIMSKSSVYVYAKVKDLAGVKYDTTRTVKYIGPNNEAKKHFASSLSKYTKYLGITPPAASNNFSKVSIGKKLVSGKRKYDNTEDYFDEATKNKATSELRTLSHVNEKSKDFGISFSVSDNGISVEFNGNYRFTGIEKDEGIFVDIIKKEDKFDEPSTTSRVTEENYEKSKKVWLKMHGSYTINPSFDYMYKHFDRKSDILLADLANAPGAAVDLVQKVTGLPDGIDHKPFSNVSKANLKELLFLMYLQQNLNFKLSFGMEGRTKEERKLLLIPRVNLPLGTSGLVASFESHLVFEFDAFGSMSTEYIFNQEILSVGGVLMHRDNVNDELTRVVIKEEPFNEETQTFNFKARVKLRTGLYMEIQADVRAFGVLGPEVLSKVGVEASMALATQLGVVLDGTDNAIQASITPETGVNYRLGVDLVGNVSGAWLSAKLWDRNIGEWSKFNYELFRIPIAEVPSQVLLAEDWDLNKTYIGNEEIEVPLTVKGKLFVSTSKTGFPNFIPTLVYVEDGTTPEGKKKGYTGKVKERWVVTDAKGHAVVKYTPGVAGGDQKFGVFIKNPDEKGSVKHEEVITVKTGFNGDIEIPDPNTKYLIISRQSLNFSSSGGTITIDVTSNENWRISGLPNWVSVTEESGTGNATINFRANKNNATRSRSVNLTITGGNVNKNISISQDAFDDTSTLSLDKYSIDVIPHGEIKSVNVRSNTNWSASTTSSDWVTISNKLGNGDGNINIKTKVNPYTTDRKAYVKIRTGTKTKTLTIKQSGRAYIESLEPQTIRVNTTVNFTITGTRLKSTMVPHIDNVEIDPDTRRVYDNGTKFTFTGTVENYPGENKNFVIKHYSNQDVQCHNDVDNRACPLNATRHVVIEPDPNTDSDPNPNTDSDPNPNTDSDQNTNSNPKNLTISRPSLSFSSSGGTKTIEVTSNEEWRISGLPNWVSVDPINGTGSAPINFTANKNTATRSRSGKLTITGSNVSRNISITQSAFVEPSTLSLRISFIIVDPYDDDKNIPVYSNTNWSASTTSSDWVTIFRGSGSGNGNINIRTKVNSLSTARTAEIKVTTGKKTKILTIKQPGRAYIESLYPKRIKVNTTVNFTITGTGLKSTMKPHIDNVEIDQESRRVNSSGTRFYFKGTVQNYPGKNKNFVIKHYSAPKVQCHKDVDNRACPLGAARHVEITN